MHNLVATGYLSVSEFESWVSHSISKKSWKRYISSLSLSTNIIRLLSVEGELIHIRNLEYCLVPNKHSAHVSHHHYHHRHHHHQILCYQRSFGLCFSLHPTVVLEKTLESPLYWQEIKPLNPKGNQHWIFIGKIGAEADASIFCPPDTKSRLVGKDPDAGKNQGQEEKGKTEDEMVGWHHRLNGHELSKLLEMVKDREAWCATDHQVAKSWAWLTDWTTTSPHTCYSFELLFYSSVKWWQ